MKIAIDLDGTLLEHPEFFTELKCAFREVGVLTARHDIPALPLDHDFLIRPEEGEIEGDTSYQWKAEQVIKHGIYTLFDDHADHIEPILHELGWKGVIFKSYWRRK